MRKETLFQTRLPFRSASDTSELGSSSVCVHRTALPSLPCPPKGRAKHFRAEQWVGLSSPLGSKRMKRDFYDWYLNASLDGADVRAFIAATVQMPSYRREGKYML